MLLLIETWSAACFWRFGLHHPFDGESRFGEPVLDPGQRQSQSRGLALQAPRQFRDERAHHRRVRARHVRDHQNQAGRVVLGDVHHLVRPGFGLVAVERAAGDTGCHPAQILDQRQPQHDRDAPQFAQFERHHGLIGGHEAAEAFGVDAAIAMRNGLERDVVDAGKPRRGSLRQARQLPAVTLGQMPGRSANLLLDQIEIIEQPFAGGRDAAIILDRGRQQVAGSNQHRLIFGQAGKKVIRGAAGAEFVRSGERLAVLLHLIGAEQLRAQRQFFVGALPRQAAGAETPARPQQTLEHPCVARPQAGAPFLAAGASRLGNY